MSGCDEAVVTTRHAAWPKLALHVMRRDSQGKSDRDSRQADAQANIIIDFELANL